MTSHFRAAAIALGFADHGPDLVAAVVAQGGENAKYGGMAFHAEVKDSDDDYIRAAYGAIGFPEYADFVGD